MDRIRRCIGLSSAVFFLFIASGPTSAQTNTPEDEYRQLIKVDSDIQPLGATPFGENIDLYNGTLSFEQTDISLKGNGPTITLARSLNSTDVLYAGVNSQRPFADWDLDIPRIETVTANAGGVTGWVVGGAHSTARCTSFGPPPTTNATQPGADPWGPTQYWYGYHLIVPGAGTQELLSRDTTNNPLAPMISGLSFPIITKSNWMIHCGVTADDGGEGFVALAPDGTQYTFTHLLYRPMAALTSPLGTAPESVTSAATITPLVADSNVLARRDALMLVTQIKDRFGNTLTYNYDGQGRLSTISANDGRLLTLTYTSASSPLINTASVSSAGAGNRTWAYSYNTSNATNPYLIAAQLPDGSTWSFQLSSFLSAAVSTEGGSCVGDTLAILTSNTATGTITTPSGLTGSFTIKPMMHGRSYVPKECFGDVSSDGHAVYSTYPEVYYQQSITSKVLSGAGIPTETWTYSYSAANQSWKTDACATESTCPTTVYTDVVDPAGHDVRSIFSNRFDASEGQLLRTDYYAASTSSVILRSEINTYANPTGGPWPIAYGYDGQSRDNVAKTKELSPLQQRQIVEEGDTYTWAAITFNNYAQVTKADRINSISGQAGIEESFTYLNDTNLWVLGLPLTVVNNTYGNQVESSNTYNSQDLLASRSAFGQLRMSYGYDTQGLLTSFTDGNNHTTTLGSYKRGIPQTIAYPDGSSESLVVDDFGQISSITDQRGATTSYLYNPVGRVTQISHSIFPVETAAWLPQQYAYSYVTSAERGLAAGHWRRTATLGNASTVTYYDAELRPVLTDTSITGTAGSDITTATAYDWQGKTTFASYPVSGAPAITALTSGTHTTYDALERETQTTQDSELGSLTITTAYLSAARVQSTDPNGNVITRTYQVFDEPSYANVILVQAPEGITQTTVRDLYGKPSSITQASLTKTFAYDSYQRLCRFYDPETSSTVYSYDAANNIAWLALGQSISGASSACGQDQVASTAMTTRTYDAMNRVLTETPPSGTQSTTYTYDAAGHMLTAATAASYWWAGYDSMGNLGGEVNWVSGQANPMAVGYAYDTSNHLAAISYYPGGSLATEAIAYAPDALGRPTQAGSYASGITYHPDGSMASYTLGNGIRFSTTQNTRLLPSNYTYSGPNGTTLDENYTYDPNGNLVTLADVVNGANNQTLSYDGLNRLINAQAPNAWGSRIYTYDALNNLRQANSNGYQINYNPDALNRMGTITFGANPFTSYTYDARGNRMTETGAGGTTTYTFDAKNQLIQIPGIMNYSYDAFGRRVEKVPASGTATGFLYGHGGQLLMAYDEAAPLNTNYIYLNGKLIARNQGGTVTYTLTDRQGTPVREASSTGVVGVSFSYDPYGTLSSGPDQQQPGYTGHVYDPETEFSYMQARYEAGPAGRMLSPDPVYPSPGDLFAFNRYDYADNNPVMHVDPDGRTCTEANKTYTCQIDKVVTQQNGKLVSRNATAEDHKTYAGLEKALTKAVNAAASSGKTANISFQSGGTTYSFSIAATSVAQNLAGRIIKADPFEPIKPEDHWAMETLRNTTTVGKYGLQPGRTIFGDAQRTQEQEFLHEGIHQSLEEKKSLGFFGSIRLGADPADHQNAYNDASNSFLEPGQ